MADGMNSVWLFSNDILRFLVSGQSEQNMLADAGGEEKLNLSHVNFYVAQSLTILANSSSQITSADTNLDPRELNDFLNNRPFISAMSQRKVEEAESGLADQVLAVKELLLNALNNVRQTDSGLLQGLSVPVRDENLTNLRHVLTSDTADYEKFLDAIHRYDAEEGPIEFQTTAKLIILYGQPKKDRRNARRN